MAIKVSTTAQTATGTSQVVPLDFHKPGDNPTSIVANLTGAAGTVSVEGTLDDIYDATVTPVWFPLTGATAVTATTFLVVAYPVRAVRLNVTAYTSGNINMKVLQGDGSN